VIVFPVILLWSCSATIRKELDAVIGMNYRFAVPDVKEVGGGREASGRKSHR